jgi:pimeloyl-ACP methyl ester carboxylesterase
VPHVRLRNCTLYYQEHGASATALVFVHGFVASQRWWRPTLERLAPADDRAYAVDLRGAGQSEAPATG